MDLPAIAAPVMRFLATGDAARAAAFYRDILGFEIRDVGGGVEAHRGPARLRFASEGGDAMVFFETADLDTMRAAILARGGAPSGIDKINWVKFRVFTMRAPDGHTLWFGQSYDQSCGPAAPPLLEKALPGLPCTDVAAAIAHYRDVLGFHINYSQHDLGVMDRDNVTVLLIARTARHTGIGSAYFYIADADALYAELRAKGAGVQGEPVSQPWGLREFHVVDGEGNELHFGQPFE
jgi:catechol 2,3-dioxygenase-like lactoylglutathione lyase family enzyme